MPKPGKTYGAGAGILMAEYIANTGAAIYGNIEFIQRI
jgi:hypothetical protein